MPPLSIALFSNRPALAIPLMDCINTNLGRISVLLSTNPEVRQAAQDRGLPCIMFPECPEGAMLARCCKEDPAYRHLVDAAYEAIREHKPEASAQMLRNLGRWPSCCPACLNFTSYLSLGMWPQLTLKPFQHRLS